MYIQQKLQEIQSCIRLIENSSGTVIEEDLNSLNQLEQLVGENPTLIKYQSIIFYNAGYTKEAKSYLASSIKKYLRCYDLHTLMYEFLRNTEDKKEIFYALSQMYKLAGCDSLRKEVERLLEETILRLQISQDDFKQYFEYFKEESTSIDYRSFPLDEYGKSVIRKDAFPERDSNSSYLVNMYKTIQKLNVNQDDRMFFLYETIRGSFIDTKANISVNEGDIIAISSTKQECTFTNLTIHNLEKEPYRITLEPNLIRYFKAKNKNEVQIEADQNIFLSHFKKNTLIEKPKLVLQIFIDGLSFEFLKNNDIEKLMPNTHSFFKTGYINHDCHANSEWTLPSLMSMCTGKYTTSHHVYHTNAPHKGEEINKFIHEYFNEAGYMTGRICSNWRGTPSYGYFKSNNRSIYAPMYERMNCDEIVTETIEHIEAFKEFNNYVWMTIEDLHGVADGLSRGILQDLSTEHLVNETVEHDSEISVFRGYNQKKIEEYKATIKKADFYLGLVFDYIKKNYSSEEYVVTLNSDHGQKFIEEDDYMFTQKRTNVPFMMQGRNVINKTSTELMSNVDIFPTLLNLCGLQAEDSLDGQLLKDFGGEQREYTITESIFPDQTYKLAINDKSHRFTFETIENTRDDGLIPVQDYTVKLINRVTGEDETEQYQDKLDQYCQITFHHIKEWIHIGEK